MVTCGWIGFIGYILALIFFLLGFISVIYMAYDAYKIGKKRGWFFILNRNDIIRKNPFNFLLFSFIILPTGGYFFIYKIIFTIIPQYLRCLASI